MPGTYISPAETGLYYLQSRYYDPEVGRFVNADGQINEGLLGANLFAYCENNPLLYSDPTGEIAILTCVLIGAAVGALLGGATGAYVSYKQYKEVKWQYVVIGVIAGAAIGAAAGYAIGVAIGASSTTALTAKTFARSFKVTSKISKQMVRRGWTDQLIKQTILKNVGRKAFNRATGHAATAYFTSTGAYVVIDNISKEIVQVSNRFDPNWVVDSTIKLLRNDVFIK